MPLLNTYLPFSQYWTYNLNWFTNKKPDVKNSETKNIIFGKTISMITLTIKDETAIGKITNEIAVSFSNELVTVKDIIIKRITAEVEQYNSKLPEYYRGLIEPAEAEKTLNGYKLRNKKKVDAEKQCLVALDAFQKNGYFVLIDNIQAENLEQMIVVNPQTNISFVKLTPLVGG